MYVCIYIYIYIYIHLRLQVIIMCGSYYHFNNLSFNNSRNKFMIYKHVLLLRDDF